MLIQTAKKWVSFAVGLILWLLIIGLSKKPGEKQLRRMEFSTSTQRMGLRFTEKLRDYWRRRWLRLYRRNNN